MISPLLLLFVAVPLLSAGLVVFARLQWLERALMLLVPAATSIGGGLLIWHHLGVPVEVHHVGSYVPGIAIVFVSDTLSATMLTITGLVTTLAAAFLISTGEDRYRFVPPLVLLLITGVNGAFLTGDLFNLFVFVEVMLLPSYALIAVTGAWRRLGIGRMFVVVNLTTSTILVVGVGLIYGAAGTVNLAQLAGAGAQNPQVSLAASVVLLALLVKGGVVPVHGWLPRSYSGTSAGIMALFSGLHTKVGLYGVYRIYSVIYGPGASWAPILLAVVVITIVVGAISTFGERRIRSAMAFQMVAGVGHILLGLVVFTQLSVAAGLFYMVHHIITMGSLVLASGAIEETYGSGRFDRLNGLMRREPVLAVVMALGLFSLVGLPPTSGLWGKVGLLAAAARTPFAEAAWLITAVLFASVVSLIALQRLWADVFWGPPMKLFQPDDPVTARGERTIISEDTRIRWRHLWPACFLIAVSVLMFVFVGQVWPVFERAAQGLVDVGAYVKGVLG